MTGLAGEICARAVEADVKYRDGRQARIEARLRIAAVEPEAVGVA